MDPKRTIYAGDDSGLLNTSKGIAGILAGAGNKRLAKKLYKNSDGYTGDSTPLLLHETKEYEQSNARQSRAMANVNGKLFDGKLMAESGYYDAEDAIPGSERIIKSPFANHQSPRVVTEESNDIRFFPNSIRDFFTGMREATGESAAITEHIGKRYGKDYISYNDATELIKRLKAGAR